MRTYAGIFVVLHHVGGDAPAHFDLLLDRGDGGAVATWRLHVWPPADGDEARRLRDHRRFYLTHEGAVPGGRGTVTRVAEGTHRTVEGHAWDIALGDVAFRLEMLDDEVAVVRL